MNEIIDFKSRAKHIAEPDQTVIELLKELIESEDVKGAHGVVVLIMDEDGGCEVHTASISNMELLWLAEQARMHATLPDEEEE